MPVFLLFTVFFHIWMDFKTDSSGPGTLILTIQALAAIDRI